jgi:hypothetical protein
MSTELVAIERINIKKDNGDADALRSCLAHYLQQFLDSASIESMTLHELTIRMQVGGYISAVGILWYLETMAEDVSAGSYMSFFPQVLQHRPTRYWCVCYLLSGGLGVAMYMVIAGGYMVLLRSLLFT